MFAMLKESMLICRLYQCGRVQIRLFAEKKSSLIQHMCAVEVGKGLFVELCAVTDDVIMHCADREGAATRVQG
jgi:hypothetical protein